MKINKIVLYNFNSYEGLNEFDFTSDDKRTGKTRTFRKERL